MSHAKQIAYGVGVIVLGAVAAQPFRRESPSLDSPSRVTAKAQPSYVSRPVQAFIPIQEEESAPPSPVAPPRIVRQDDDDSETDLRPPPPALDTRAAPPRLDSEFPRELNERQETNDVRKHRLRDGDTLPRLAERYLGSANRAREIFDGNAGLLTDPDLLPIGVEIRIPNK